jgi:hypothetical protein
VAVTYEKFKTKKSSEALAVYHLGNELKTNKLIDLKFNPIFKGEHTKKEVMRIITETIHGIQGLFSDVELPNIQIYLGKTAIDQLPKRAESHWQQKDTPYFIPVIKVKASDVDYIEKLGLKYLKFLEKNNNLCFGKLLNSGMGGEGRRSSSKSHIIYLAFRIDQRKNSSTPISKEQIGLALGHLHYTLKDQFPKESDPKAIKDILTVISRVKKGTKLYWDIDSTMD